MADYSASDASLAEQMDQLAVASQEEAGTLEVLESADHEDVMYDSDEDSVCNVPQGGVAVAEGTKRRLLHSLLMLSVFSTTKR